MSTVPYHAAYQALQAALQSLGLRLEQAEPMMLDPAAPLRQVFQEQILPLPLDDLNAETASVLNPLRTEIHRELQLLTLDLKFLQAARNEVTQQQRRRQSLDRVQTLLQYCEAALSRLKTL
jgi:hypothetical protein